MFRRLFLLIATVSLLTAIYFQAAIAQTFSLYTGRVAEARAHFRTYGPHMRGVVLMSEAIFRASDGKDIPYDRIRFAVTAVGQGNSTICYEVIRPRCDALPLEPQYVVPIMNWISSGGTAAFTLAKDRSLAFLKSEDMQPVSKSRHDAEPSPFHEEEYVAAPLNDPSLVKLLQDVDYKNVPGEKIASQQATEILKIFNEGVVTTGSKKIDVSYTVNDYFSQFIVTVSENAVSYSGVPTRLYWELYEGQAPLATGIRPLLTSTEIATTADDQSIFSGEEILQSLKDIWNSHATACSKNQYPTKIKAIDRYLASTKAGASPSRRASLLIELEKLGIEYPPDVTDRARLVERQKQCDTRLLSSITQKLMSVPDANPSFQSLEDAVRSWPKGFDDVVAEFQDAKEAWGQEKREQEETVAKRKELQQHVLDFYSSVAILRGFRRHQPQAFTALLGQLSR